MSTRRILLPTKSLITTARRRSITATHNVSFGGRTSPASNSYNFSTQRKIINRGFESLTNPSYKEETAAAATEAEDDDPCPDWQNPLHHNNPEFQKVFAEDFEPGEEMPTVPLPPFSSPDSTVDAPPHIQSLANEIVQLNLLELAALMERIGDHFGFDDSMAYGGDEGGGEGGGDAAAAEVKEEKTTFDLKLEGFDAKAKIKVIKEIRSVTGLGLKEAKELVEGAPATIKKDIKMEEAEELKAKLEAVGATVSIA